MSYGQGPEHGRLGGRFEDVDSNVVICCESVR